MKGEEAWGLLTPAVLDTLDRARERKGWGG